jgi:hypothetical protein
MPRLISGASTGLVPSCAARGMASRTTVSAASSVFDSFTGWTTTDSNRLGILTTGGYCLIPQGFGGRYQLTFFTNGLTTQNYNTAFVYYYNGSSYSLIIGDYAFNDYSNYTCGGTHILDMKVDDRVYFGIDNRYGVPASSNHYSRMSMQFLGH